LVLHSEEDGFNSLSSYHIKRGLPWMIRKTGEFYWEKL
jgi:hypothetical protein